MAERSDHTSESGLCLRSLQKSTENCLFNDVITYLLQVNLRNTLIAHACGLAEVFIEKYCLP